MSTTDARALTAAATERGTAAVLRLRDIDKAYPGVQALTGVDLEVLAGEVHAVVGENGAGKSTLMGVAVGSVTPDRGTVEIAGEALDRADPARSRELGAAIVYQHPAILPDLTVAENFMLGIPRDRRPAMRDLRATTRAALAELSLDVDPGRRADTLSMAQRHLLEIAKALASEPKVLILDEPTEPLGRAEIELLFTKVRELAGRGIGVVYISHRLPDVRRIADRITVLRDGCIRGTSATGDISEAKIVRLIVGRPVDLAFPEKAQAPAGPRLTVAALSGPGFDDVDVTLSAGEIVGFAGVEGNGQRDFIRALAGLEPVGGGSAQLDGRPVRLGDAGAATGAGIVFMPADRHGEGLLMPMSVRENAALLNLRGYARGGFVNRRRERAAVRAQVEALHVKTPGLETTVSSLSGGNQQKVVLARALLAEPAVLLADEPTQGVDAASRMDIYRVLRRSADAGAAVAVTCSDGIELEGLCDRVLVFSRGRVVRELTGADVTEANITEAALTASEHHERARASGSRRLLGRGDYGPALVLAVVMVLLGLYTAAASENYLTVQNFQSYLLLLSALGFIALGQLLVVLLGGIDLSVGPLSGFLLVLSSFIVVPGGAGLGAGLLALLGAALVVGLFNGVLIRKVRINPVVATLVTYFILQGLSLALRPTAGGEITESAVDMITLVVGWVPVSILVVAGLALVLEFGLRRTIWGMQLRATGSDEAAAARLGTRVDRVWIAGYAGCAVLTAGGAVMLMAQLGTGDPNAGINYTLASIAAVVLGGASVFGGRGAFIGALLGAALLQQITNVSPFLGLSQAWQYWLLGGLTVLAATAYSRTRSSVQ